MTPINTLEAIRTRRVIRSFTDEVVSRDLILQVFEASRWSPAAHNMRFLKYLCITEQNLIDQIRLFSPGMAGLPSVLIVLCLDWEQATIDAPGKQYNYLYIDLGIVVQNMLLAVHDLGLGGWPIVSFSQEAVAVLLNLPEGIRPEMFVGLGFPATPMHRSSRRPKKLINLVDMVNWGPYPIE